MIWVTRTVRMRQTPVSTVWVSVYTVYVQYVGAGRLRDVTCTSSDKCDKHINLFYKSCFLLSKLFFYNKLVNSIFRCNFSARDNGWAMEASDRETSDSMHACIQALFVTQFSLTTDESSNGRMSPTAEEQ